MRLVNRSDASTPSAGRATVSWRSEQTEAPMIADSFAARLPRHSTCSSCGLRRVAGMRFCQGCGLDFDAEVRSSRVRSWTARGRAPAARPTPPDAPGLSAPLSRRLGSGVGIPVGPGRPETPARRDGARAVASRTHRSPERSIVVGDGLLDLTRRQVDVLGIGIGVVAAALIGLIGLIAR
jgi:hypothetical protein